MDNTEAVAYWESLGSTSSQQRAQAALLRQLIEQNTLLFAEVAQLKAQVATLTAKPAQNKTPLAEQSQQRKKQQKTLPAKQIALAKQQDDKETDKRLAINPKIMATVRRLSALEALSGIAQADIYEVLLAHQQGVKKSAIYQHLGWGSAKHTKIVKPVVDALQVSNALQAV